MSLRCKWLTQPHVKVLLLETCKLRSLAASRMSRATMHEGGYLPRLERSDVARSSSILIPL